MGRIFPWQFGLDLMTDSPVVSFENRNTQLRAEGHDHPASTWTSPACGLPGMDILMGFTHAIHITTSPQRGLLPSAHFSIVMIENH